VSFYYDSMKFWSLKPFPWMRQRRGHSYVKKIGKKGNCNRLFWLRVEKLILMDLLDENRLKFEISSILIDFFPFQSSLTDFLGFFKRKEILIWFLPPLFYMAMHHFKFIIFENLFFIQKFVFSLFILFYRFI